MTSVNAKPVPMATSRMHSTNVTTMGFLNMLFKSDTSGMEQPAPPRMSAMTTPADTPFSMRIPAMGIIVSTRMYMGMPITAASGMAQRLSAPASPSRSSVGTNP